MHTHTLSSAAAIGSAVSESSSRIIQTSSASICCSMPLLLPCSYSARFLNWVAFSLMAIGRVFA